MTRTYMALLVALFAAFRGQANELPQAYIQAHRGGLDEVPENTMSAFEHAWAIPGAIPEMDLRTTKDGVVILMHDETPTRTTNAPPPWGTRKIAEIPFDQVKTWDAGVKFSAKYAGTHVPSLAEVFSAMKGRPERQVYLDLKAVDVETLKAAIQEHGLEQRVLFVHGTIAECARLKALYPGARTMTWISGSPKGIADRFARITEAELAGLSQLQFHLQVASPGPPIKFLLDDDFLRGAAAKLKQAGVELQLRPFAFDHESLRRLLELGVRWYVADAPKAFQEALAGGKK